MIQLSQAACDNIVVRGMFFTPPSTHREGHYCARPKPDSVFAGSKISRTPRIRDFPWHGDIGCPDYFGNDPQDIGIEDFCE